MLQHLMSFILAVCVVGCAGQGQRDMVAAHNDGENQTFCGATSTFQASADVDITRAADLGLLLAGAADGGPEGLAAAQRQLEAREAQRMQMQYGPQRPRAEPPPPLTQKGTRVIYERDGCRVEIVK